MDYSVAAANKKNGFIVGICGILSVAIFISPAYSATYSQSAHGDTTEGVCRDGICESAGIPGDYSRGNCTNCHEQHASINGEEPAPTGGAPSAFSLFTENFDTTVVDPPYVESDDICFSCHNESGSIMQVTNYNYSQTFGGYQYSVDPTFTVDSILEAFTPYPGYTHSQHNLKDVYNYAKDHFSYFTESSNPCAACHNPHLARRNKSEVDNPELTVISRPTDHDNLWGDDPGETMKDFADSVGGEYQPPYYYDSTTIYEPGGVGDHDGSKTPDYNTFCLDCHANSDVYSSELGRNLNPIDWSGTGDMHGGSPRYSGDYVSGAGINLPYNDNSDGNTPNYVLACVDCHEPHGTLMQNDPDWQGNSFLLRKMINGTRVGGSTSGPGHLIDKEWNWSHYKICNKCHNIGLHCGGDNDCFGCHYHNSIQSSGCTQSWGPHKAF